MSDLTTRRQQVRLGLLKGECPHCKQGRRKRVLGGGRTVEEATTALGQWVECSICKGTGQVYLLPNTVRVPCPGDYSISQWTVLTQPSHGNLSKGEYIKSCNCHGLGWTPPESLAVWLETLVKPLGVSIAFCHRDSGVELKLTIARAAGDDVTPWIWGATFFAAFISALLAALKPLAVNYTEALKFIEERVK